MPTKIPVELPTNRSGDLKAFSRVSHVTSSKRRCCGSMVRASRGDIPKNRGSNMSIRSRKAALRVYIFPGAFGSESKNASRSHRSAGTSRLTSLASESSCQNSCGLFAPGKRQLIPTRASGSAAITSR